MTDAENIAKFQSFERSLDRSIADLDRYIYSVRLRPMRGAKAWPPPAHGVAKLARQFVQWLKRRSS